MGQIEILRALNESSVPLSVSEISMITECSTNSIYHSLHSMNEIVSISKSNKNYYTVNEWERERYKNSQLKKNIEEKQSSIVSPRKRGGVLVAQPRCPSSPSTHL